jgi:hypothetical protein
MSRIFRDSSVLNQFGSPSLNSNTIANRPTAGQTGRLFVSTDTLVLYRDNGTSWQVVSATGATQNLEQTTTNGNTTTKGIFAGATGALTAGFLLEVLGRTKFTATSGNTVYIGLPNITPNSATFDVFGYSSFRLFTDAAANIGSIMRNDFVINLNANITTGDPSASINQLTLTCNNIASIGNVSGGLIYAGAGLNKNTITDDGTADSTITLTQNSGIFALSPLQSISEYTGLGGTNITHYAGLVINGVKATAGSALRIVNNYQLLINSSQQFSGSTTITNRWGIYQAGSNDRNYFSGQSIFNDRVDFNSLIVVAASVYSSGNATNFISGNTNNLTFYNNGITTILGTIFTSGSGNWRIGTGTDSGDKLQVNGNTYSNSMSIAGGLQAGFVLDVTGSSVFRSSTYIFNGALFINTTGISINLTTPVSTGVHTTSGNHLPISINGTTYWIALLNPPVLP